MDTLRYKIFIILIIGVILNICQVSAASRNPSDCCLATNDKKIPYKLIRAYRHQGEGSGCYIPAIVFTTVRNRHLCAPTDSDWVKKYMRCLEKNAKKC
ncbi:C-C motif chemokine 19-like [Rana temporaria]|uniref:C-C motif chemokine 19-like n=1 Tax=Rana temporaria TaxID=8407 RepID=UPI001AAD57EB|nr:C-C motif chemokine 19-like [Rana temporaria]